MSSAANDYETSEAREDLRVQIAGARLRDSLLALSPASVEALIDALDERDRYREALERVYQVGRGPHVAIAREALDRG